MSDEPRLVGRNGEIWRAYLDGATQEKIGERYGISQVQVSRIIAEVRASIPAPVMADIMQDEAERIAALYEMTMEIARAHHPVVSLQRGEVVPGIEDAGPRLAAIGLALKVHERIAKALGTDAAQKIDTNAAVKFTYEGVDVDRV
jgi:DNA-binding transcriptional regulator LsrR (DeoR family)